MGRGGILFSLASGKPSFGQINPVVRPGRGGFLKAMLLFVDRNSMGIVV